MFKIGERFKLYDYDREDDDTYLLAQVAPFKVALIGLDSGNRWYEGGKVVDPSKITPDEFEIISYCAQGQVFERIEYA
jgi:hypothetical protein